MWYASQVKVLHAQGGCPHRSLPRSPVESYPLIFSLLCREILQIIIKISQNTLFNSVSNLNNFHAERVISICLLRRETPHAGAAAQGGDVPGGPLLHRRGEVTLGKGTSSTTRIYGTFDGKVP